MACKHPEEKRVALLIASNAELALLLYDRIDTGREGIFKKSVCHDFSRFKVFPWGQGD